MLSRIWSTWKNAASSLGSKFPLKSQEIKKIMISLGFDLLGRGRSTPDGFTIYIQLNFEKMGIELKNGGIFQLFVTHSLP